MDNGDAAVLIRRARFHPHRVGPAEVFRDDHGRGFRRDLVMEGERVCFVDRVTAVPGHDPVLVNGARFDAGHEPFPDSARVAKREGRPVGAPSIEVADHRHGFGVRGVHREAAAGFAVAGRQVGSQLVLEVEMAAFVKEIEVLVRDEGTLRRSGRGFPFARRLRTLSTRGPRPARGPRLGSRIGRFARLSRHGTSVPAFRRRGP